MRRSNATSLPRKRWHSAAAPASLWFAVFSLSLLGPLVCIIHCIEAQRATHSGPAVTDEREVAS